MTVAEFAEIAEFGDYSRRFWRECSATNCLRFRRSATIFASVDRALQPIAYRSYAVGISILTHSSCDKTVSGFVSHSTISGINHSSHQFRANSVFKLAVQSKINHRQMDLWTFDAIFVCHISRYRYTGWSY